jgi:hypothetical protein
VLTDTDELSLEVQVTVGKRHTVMNEFRDASNQACPASNEYEGEDHAWKHTAMHTHEVWKLAVSFHITWTNLGLLAIVRRFGGCVEFTK